MQAMTSTEAEREYYVLSEGFKEKRHQITEKRDSWEGGRSVTYSLFATCTVSMIVSGDCVSYCGRWA